MSTRVILKRLHDLAECHSAVSDHRTAIAEGRKYNNCLETVDAPDEGYKAVSVRMKQVLIFSRDSTSAGSIVTGRFAMPATQSEIK
ncbi:hypothetical protein J6590_103031 [Homalodisca vitripennis]|nr:hypothetical protein J6590_103031 [Homalodisca vitripennis]